MNLVSIAGLLSCLFLLVNARLLPRQTGDPLPPQEPRKAGLTWVNGYQVNVAQFTHTGKVSW